MVARHHHFVLGELGTHEVARRSQLALVRDVDPQAPEYALLLEREYGRVRIGAAMHVVGPHQAAQVRRREGFCRVAHGVFHPLKSKARQFTRAPNSCR